MYLCYSGGLGCLVGFHGGNLLMVWLVALEEVAIGIVVVLFLLVGAVGLH